MDAVPGDPDGNDCGGRGGVREVPRRVLSVGQRDELAVAHRACAGVADRADGAGQHGYWSEHREPGGDCDDYAADADEHDGREDGRGSAECLHLAKVLALACGWFGG